MTEPFGARLRAGLDRYGPLCVGIDPHPGLLHTWGLPDDARGLERFSLTTVDALTGEVALVKPQSAFFERHGAAGVAVLEKLITHARSRGLLVLLDVKRGDIGSTASAYAEAYLDPASTLGVDAVTVSPYLGFGTLEPFLTSATEHGGGVFVLALTSNPEGDEVQRARSGEHTVAGNVLAQVRVRNAGADPLGSTGAVVGATVGVTGEDLDVNGPLLVPGLGAQGGSVGDIDRLFTTVRANVVPTTSRSVLRAGPDVDAIRSATRQVQDALRS